MAMVLQAIAIPQGLMNDQNSRVDHIGLHVPFYFCRSALIALKSLRDHVIRMRVQI